MTIEKDIVHNAVGKMLNVLGLHIKLHKFTHQCPGVSEDSLIVRTFIDKHGNVLEWHNDNPYSPSRKYNGNGILGGSWTVFKNDDAATFSLFTEKIRWFKMVHSNDDHGKCNDKKDNPFYGCKSVEEVLVKCDLLCI